MAFSAPNEVADVRLVSLKPSANPNFLAYRGPLYKKLVGIVDRWAARLTIERRGDGLERKERRYAISLHL